MIRCGEPQKLPLRELRAAAGAVEAGLLAFFHAGIPRKEMLLTEFVREIAVVAHQRPGDALHAGAGLPGAAAAMDANHHVHAVPHTRMIQRGNDCISVLWNGEVVLQGALVDRELATAGANSHAGNGGFAAAGSEGVDDFSVAAGM